MRHEKHPNRWMSVQLLGCSSQTLAFRFLHHSINAISAVAFCASKAEPFHTRHTSAWHRRQKR